MDKLWQHETTCQNVAKRRAHLKQNMTNAGNVPFCDDPVCPHPVQKPVNCAHRHAYACGLASESGAHRTSRVIVRAPRATPMDCVHSQLESCQAYAAHSSYEMHTVLTVLICACTPSTRMPPRSRHAVHARAGPVGVEHGCARRCGEQPTTLLL